MVEFEMATETAAGRGNACGWLQSQEPTPACGEKPVVNIRRDEKEKDMNVKEKALSKEYVDKVEDLDVQKRWASSEELNIDPKDRESKEVVSQGGKKKKARSAASLCKKPILGVFVYAVLLFVSHAQGAVVIETKQALPPECLEKLVYNGCNELRAHVEDCCKDYPGWVFHCQNDEINGTLHSIAACLPEQLVPPGKMGKLIRNKTGYGELDLVSDCGPNTYRSESTVSSLIQFRYCTEVKTKPTDQENIICDGGPSADDLVICKEGFTSQCSHPFSRAHDLCFCEPLNCKEGSKPFRKLTGKCSDGSKTAEYNCTIAASPQGKPTISYPRTSASGTEPEPSVTTTQSPAASTNGTTTSHDRDGNSTTKVIVIVIIVVIIVVCLLACLVGMFVWYCRRNSQTERRDAVALMI